MTNEVKNKAADDATNDATNDAGADTTGEDKEKDIDYWKSRAAIAEADAGLSSVISDKKQRAELVKTLFAGVKPDSVSDKVEKLAMALSAVAKPPAKPPAKKKDDAAAGDDDKKPDEDDELSTLIDSIFEERLNVVMDKVLGQKLAPLGANLGSVIKDSSKTSKEEKEKKAKAAYSATVKKHLKDLLSRRRIVQRPSE